MSDSNLIRNLCARLEELGGGRAASRLSLRYLHDDSGAPPMPEDATKESVDEWVLGFG